MNRRDDPTQRVRSWLREEANGELPDRVLERTFDLTRGTSQRQRSRGWLARFRVSGGSTTRRKANMFTFATISAVAVTALLATNVLVDRTPADAPGAEAPAIAVEEQMFTGSFAYGLGCTDDTTGAEIDGCWNQSGVIFNDPRFQGKVEMRANADHQDQGIYVNQFTIITDEGSWVGDPVPGILASPGDGVPSVHLFAGEGAYDGLHAVATVDLQDGVFLVDGYVVHGGFPELSGD